MKALETGETLQDTEMTEELDSEEEVKYYLILSLFKSGLLLLFHVTKKGSEYDKGNERSEHSSLEDFEECDSSLAADSADGNIYRPIYILFRRYI